MIREDIIIAASAALTLASTVSLQELEAVIQFTKQLLDEVEHDIMNYQSCLLTRVSVR